ncbi:hypothetical protein QTI66_31295 [Variovorax sp. J22R133]|uniref:hypothetical protein n=1 Tax=Variovorax brevis TaxID=3053503 RepID=UPI002578BA8D|nr:hypothetical protein [Variovorax sp. J22R133]MDM0116628.1 hypothetical protein [Variovorax sp. J22R133]
MNFSTDEQRKESLQLLQETADYLKRLPMAPLTRGFIARIEAHLAAPTARLTLERPRVLTAQTYSPEGRPVVRAKLVGNVLTVRVHKDGQALVAKGLELPMVEDKDDLHWDLTGPEK